MRKLRRHGDSRHQQQVCDHAGWLTRQRLLQWLPLLLLPMLFGCDGGLFGTGDGSDIVTPPVVDASDPDETDGGGESPTDGDDQVDADDEDGADGSVDAGSQVSPQAFENLYIGSDRQAPLIDIINATSLPLNLVIGEQTSTLLDQDLQSGESAELVEVATGTTSLSVVDAGSGSGSDSLSTLWQLSPLNLGSSSVSLLLARDADEAPSESEDDATSDNPIPRIEVLALPSRWLLADDMLARVRLVQISAIDGDERAAEMRLLPAGANPGGSEVSLGTVSPSQFLQATTHQLLDPGSYELHDALQRFEPIALDLLAAHWYTILITGPDGSVQVWQETRESP